MRYNSPTLAAGVRRPASYEESLPYYMTRNTAALIIAVLFHLLILLLFWLLGFLMVKHAPPKEKPQEQRIKVALKELPKAKRNAAVKNQIKPTEKIPPMPKGSQLEKLPKPASQSAPLPTPQQQIPAKPAEPAKPQQKIPTPHKIAEPEKMTTKSEPLPPEKPYIPYMKETEPVKEAEKAETNATDIPDTHQKLFAKLSKKQIDIQKRTSSTAVSKRESRIPDDIREAYGDAFQKYLLDNQEIMRRLTQAQLDDTGRTMIPNTLRVNDSNIVEFYLHPDGSMTDFKFVNHSGFFLLDEVTKETIESVYWKYPRPKEKTLIRYKFGYYLRGY